MGPVVWAMVHKIWNVTYDVMQATRPTEGGDPHRLKVTLSNHRRGGDGGSGSGGNTGTNNHGTSALSCNDGAALVSPTSAAREKAQKSIQEI